MSKSPVFYLGNNKPIKLKRMISFIENYFGKKAILKFENSEDEVQKTFADLTKSREILKYEPKTLFEEGMTNFLRWFSTYEDK